MEPGGLDELDQIKVGSAQISTVEFASKGSPLNPCTVLRPKPLSWPDNQSNAFGELLQLDKSLSNESFMFRPVEWLLKRGLTVEPKCPGCCRKMTLSSDRRRTVWICRATSICKHHVSPIVRPPALREFSFIPIDKLMFSIYYWASCISFEHALDLLSIKPDILRAIWQSLQRICRDHLATAYPQIRLSSTVVEGLNGAHPKEEPIDLISIKLKRFYIICAKHPLSNSVRLAIYDAEKNNCGDFITIVKAWFAHGSNIRVSEKRFSGLTDARPDIKLLIVPLRDMIFKNKSLNPDSAFGYILRQLSNLFKGIDSKISDIPVEDLKLTLEELQWRETYASCPKNAFNTIIDLLVAQNSAELFQDACQQSSQMMSQTELITIDDSSSSDAESNPIWIEEYFYAIKRKSIASQESHDEEPAKVPLFVEMAFSQPTGSPFICHICHLLFDAYNFNLHSLYHADQLVDELTYCKRDHPKGYRECRHCFKLMEEDQLTHHSTLFNRPRRIISRACRICCISFKDKNDFIKHMFQLHHKHDTPYVCPECQFASSFQNDVINHFREKHNKSLSILCTLCLKSFALPKPETATTSEMLLFSRKFNNHLLDHYELSKQFTCNRCCLSFTSKKSVNHHKRKYHISPVTTTEGILIEPFTITNDIRKFCTRIADLSTYLSLDKSSSTEEDTQVSVGTSKRYSII